MVKTEGKEIWSPGSDSPGVSLLCSVPSAGVNRRGVIPNHVEFIAKTQKGDIFHGTT